MKISNMALSLLTLALCSLGSTTSQAQEAQAQAQEAQAQEVDAEKAPTEAESSRPTVLRVDRPSFANSSKTVGNGVNSLEAGVLVTKTKGDPNALTQTPLLYRVGVSDEFEFRLATSGLNAVNSTVGWADLSPGFKWNFHQGEDVSVGLVGAISVPLGHRELRPGGVIPALSLAFDVPVDDDTGLLFNVGAISSGDGQERVIQGFVTGGVSQTLNDRMSIYLELAAFTPSEPGGKNTVAGDVVLTYLVNDNFQLDAAYFKGFSTGGLNWATTIGMATRF